MAIDDPELFDHLLNKLALKVLARVPGIFSSTKRGVSESPSRSAALQELAAAPRSTLKSSQTHNSVGKRSAGFRESQEDADDADDIEDFKRQRRPVPDPQTGRSLLACPYFKMDPTRYSERNIEEQCYRGCSSSLLRNIPRLKQHLYRVHRRPEYYCSRCHATFKTQALVDSHNRQRLTCEVSEPQFQERMDNDQMNAIKRRNRRADIAAEWVSIFKILFPNQNLPTSPYTERGSSQAVQDFVAFFQNEAPSMLTDLIGENLGTDCSWMSILETS